MENQLLQAAKHALEFIQSIDGYENSTTANELREAIGAVEHSVQADLPDCVCKSGLGYVSAVCLVFCKEKAATANANR